MDGDESDLEDDAHLLHLSHARDAFVKRQEHAAARPATAAALLSQGPRRAAAPALRQQQQQLAGQLEHQQQVRHRQQAEAQQPRRVPCAVVPTHALLALCGTSNTVTTNTTVGGGAAGAQVAAVVVPPVDISRAARPLERRTPLVRAWTEDEELRLLQGVVQYGEGLLFRLLLLLLLREMVTMVVAGVHRQLDDGGGGDGVGAARGRPRAALPDAAKAHRAQRGRAATAGDGARPVPRGFPAVIVREVEGKER